MSLSKAIPIHILGKAGQLLVKTGDTGTGLTFSLAGPAPLSAIFAGRNKMLESPLGKLLQKIALRDVNINVQTPHSILSLFRGELTPLDFVKGVELSIQGSADFGEADINGLPKLGSLTLTASYSLDGLQISLQSERLKKFSIAFLPESHIHIRDGVLRISLSREASTPSEIDPAPRAPSKALPSPQATKPAVLTKTTHVGGGKGKKSFLLLEEEEEEEENGILSLSELSRKSSKSPSKPSKAVATTGTTPKSPLPKKKLDVELCLEAIADVKFPFLKEISTQLAVCVNPTSGSLDLNAQMNMNVQILFLHLKHVQLNAGIQFKPAFSGSFSLAAEADILNLPVRVELSYANKALALEAFPINDKPIKLTTVFPELKSMPPQLTDIQLNEFLFRGSIGPGQAVKVLLRGDATILGLRVILEVKVNFGAAGKGLVIKGMLPTQDQSQMKGTFLGFFASMVDKAALIVSTYPHFDADIEYDVPKGLAFFARLKPVGFMVKAAEFVKSVCKRQLDFQGISVFGSVDFGNPRNSEFEINLPAFPRGIFGTDKVWPGPFSLRVTGLPSVGFQLGLLAQFDSTRLEFMARFMIDTISVTVSASMKGIWRNPLGLKGFAFGDLAISFSLNWQSGVPSGFGITGKMEIGTTKMHFALAVDASSGFLISGSMSRLTLKDIVLLATKVGAPLSPAAISKIPTIELHDFRLHFATMDMRIGPFLFYQGFRLSGRIVILKSSLAVDVSVSREGIKIFGELPHINWGPLKLYRPTSKVVKIVEPAALALRRVDMIKSADDVKKLPPGTPPSPGGPVVYLELTPQKQELYVSGAIEVLGSKLSVILYLSPTLIAAEFELKLGSIFWITVDLKAEITAFNFVLNAKFKNDFGTVIRREVDSGIKKGVAAIQKQKEAVGNARKRAYDNLNAQIRSFQNTINDLNRQKEALKRQLLIFLVTNFSQEELEGAGWLGAIKRGFERAVGAVANVAKTVVNKVVHTAKTVVHHVKTGVVKAATAVKDAAVKAAHWAKIQAQIVAIDVKIKWNQTKMWGVEKIAKGAVYVGTKIAEGALAFAQLAMQAVNKAIQFLLSHFAVISGHFSCNVQALTVSGSLVYRLGSPKDQRLAFNMDLKNPLAAVASIGAGFAANILKADSVKKAIGFIPLIDVDQHLEGVPLSFEDKREMKAMVRAIELDALQEEGLLLSL